MRYTRRPKRGGGPRAPTHGSEGNMRVSTFLRGVYCTVQEEWCRPMVAAFEKKTGIKVLMTRKSAGEFYAQIKAESANPRGDIWWGGTGDPHMQAAEEGRTEPYKSPKMAELQDWAVRQWDVSKGRTVGVYAGALGYSYNVDQLKKKNIPEP